MTIGWNELQDMLAVNHERGYVLDDEENGNGMRCIAAPAEVDNTV